MPRRRDLHVRLTDEEFELVASAAAADASAVAAWVGSIAVRAASEQAVPVAWREVLQQLVRLRLDLASPTNIAAVPDSLLERIDLLIREAGVRARRS